MWIRNWINVFNSGERKKEGEEVGAQGWGGVEKELMLLSTCIGKYIFLICRLLVSSPTSACQGFTLKRIEINMVTQIPREGSKNIRTSQLVMEALLRTLALKANYTLPYHG